MYLLLPLLAYSCRVGDDACISGMHKRYLPIDLPPQDNNKRFLEAVNITSELISSETPVLLSILFQCSHH